MLPNNSFVSNGREDAWELLCDFILDQRHGVEREGDDDCPVLELDEVVFFLYDGVLCDKRLKVPSLRLFKRDRVAVSVLVYLAAQGGADAQLSGDEESLVEEQLSIDRLRVARQDVGDEEL